MNPLEEFLLEKNGSYQDFRQGVSEGWKALPSEMGQKLPSALAGSAVATVGALGLAGVSMAANKLYDAMTKKRDFRTMMESGMNADLAQHHAQDPKNFNQMFSSLRMMNPTFTKDPIIAGHYMRKMLESPMSAGGSLVEALGQRETAEKGQGGFLKALGKAAPPEFKLKGEYPTDLAGQRQTMAEKLKADIAKQQAAHAKNMGKVDEERLNQQRRDQIRALRGFGP